MYSAKIKNIAVKVKANGNINLDSDFFIYTHI